MLCVRYIEEIGIGEITFAGSHVVLDEPILFEQGFLLFGVVDVSFVKPPSPSTSRSTAGSLVRTVDRNAR